MGIKHPTVGVDDLATLAPQVAAEWHCSKNVGLQMTDFVAGSAKIVWWKCSNCKHEWRTSIRARMVRKTGCPECAKRLRGAKHIETVILQHGCLTDEKLLKDWDWEENGPLTPEQCTPVSNRIVAWKCHVCGYKWRAKISNRVHGRGCSACAGKVLFVGHNDLATLEPELAKEWHPTKNGKLKPCDVMRGQSRKVWWLCPRGHSYFASLNKRTSDHTGCPVCNSGRQTSFREQAFLYYLKQIFPDTVSRYQTEWLGRFELDIFIPSQSLAIEYDGAVWHQQKRFERERRKYKLCKTHGIRLIRIKEQMPDEQDGWDLADEIMGIGEVEKGRNFQLLLQQVIDRLDPRSNIWKRQNPCQVQSPIRVDLDRDRFAIRDALGEVKNSFGEKFPELAKEWHPIRNGDQTPYMFKPGSDFRAWWCCPKCGHEYEASIAHRTSGTGCGKCKREKFAVSYRRRRLDKVGGITDERLLGEWNYERNGDKLPSDFTPGCQDKVWWKCPTCEYEWEAKIANRTHGRGCPCCANRVVVVGKNDLATTHPELVHEWDMERNTPLTPQQITAGYNQKVWWICSKCNRSYAAPPARRSKGSGCRKCADIANRGPRKRKYDLPGQLILGV